MFKYALMATLALPTFGLAADYNASGDLSKKGCSLDQAGNRYCIVRPIEKQYTNCDPGMDCRHMESGQHYSVQAPIVPSEYAE